MHELVGTSLAITEGMSLRPFTRCFLLATLFVALCASQTLAGGKLETVRVWSGNMHDWRFVDDGTGLPCYTPDCGIERSTQPLAGDGSARLAVDNIFEPFKRSMLFAPIAKGKHLRNAKALAFTSFVWPLSSSALAPMVVFNIDLDLHDQDDSWQGRLVFDPRHQADIQTVVRGQWQTWNALDAGALWYLTDVPADFLNWCVETSPCTFAQFIGFYPHAGLHRIFGGVGLSVGGWGLEQIETSVDAITIGLQGKAQTFDFETGGPITGKECKDGGWIGYFENQADCVRHFQKGPKVKSPVVDDGDALAPASYKECKYNGWVGYFDSESQCVDFFKQAKQGAVAPASAPASYKECKYNGWVGYFDSESQCVDFFKQAKQGAVAPASAPASYKECKYNGWVGYFDSESQCVDFFKQAKKGAVAPASAPASYKECKYNGWAGYFDSESQCVDFFKQAKKGAEFDSGSECR
jgi:hypothetical protein